MTADNLIKILSDLNQLKEVPMSTLDEMIEQYPYCQNFHFLKAKKLQIEGHHENIEAFQLLTNYIQDKPHLYNRFTASECENLLEDVESKKLNSTIENIIIQSKSDKIQDRSKTVVVKSKKTNDEPTEKKKSSPIPNDNIEKPSIVWENIEENDFQEIDENIIQESLSPSESHENEKILKDQKEDDIDSIEPLEEIEQEHSVVDTMPDDSHKQKKTDNLELIEEQEVDEEVTFVQKKKKKKKKIKRKGKLPKEENTKKKKKKKKKEAAKELSNPLIDEWEVEKNLDTSDEDVFKEEESTPFAIWLKSLKSTSETMQAPDTEPKMVKKEKKKKSSKKEQKDKEKKKLKKLAAKIKKQKKKKKKAKKKARKKDKLQQKIDASLERKSIIASPTLAEIMANQGHYKEAINIYEELLLINPEKSSYFAAQIKKLKKLC